MKYTIVSWNCNGGFRNKFPQLLKAYPEADIFVIHECEDPYFYDVEEFKRLFTNGFRIGFKQKGIAVFARDGIAIRRLDWPGDTCGFAFAPTLIDGAFTLLACWTQGNYIEQLHNYLDANLDKFGKPALMIGDLNSSVTFDKNPRQRSHSSLVERLDQVGLRPLYHHFSGDEQGKETIPTYYHLRKVDRPFHIRAGA